MYTLCLKKVNHLMFDNNFGKFENPKMLPNFHVVRDNVFN